MSDERPYIIIDSQDNVATALVDLKSGYTLDTESGDVVLLNDIAFGHKFALMEIPEGAFIVKYGAQIGRATASIPKGDHVHVHNVEDITDEVRKQ
jgi:membrane protein implicated in regulation of membrane protease activity